VKQHGVGSPHRHCFHSPLRASSSCIPRHSLINHLNAYPSGIQLWSKETPSQIWVQEDLKAETLPIFQEAKKNCPDLEIIGP
jgi:hypothetical protein